MSKDLNRVVFYSKKDLSGVKNLQNAELVIEGFSPEKVYVINDIIELYHIKLYFDNELYRRVWSNETKTKYIKIVNSFWDVITKFFIEINSQNIKSYFETLDYEYYESFWALLSQLNIYKGISSESISEILQNSRFNIRDLLKQKKIVNHFPKIIKEYLINSTESAELLLSYYEEDHYSERPKFFFPITLNDDEKELIIINYLDSPNTNLNYVRLVVKSRALKISNKTKLKAKRIENKLNEEIFEKGVGSFYRVQVSISKDQNEPYKREVQNGIRNHIYSEKWLDATNTYEHIFLNFTYLFNYINEQGCIDLVSKSQEIDSIDSVLMRSKNDYLITNKFFGKSQLSQLQIEIYLIYLKEKKISLEQVLSYQVNKVLNEEYDIKGLTISFASDNATPLEKIRFIAPEIEFLIKQYQCYVEEGIIDFELIKINTSQLYLSKVKSKLKRKYVYGEGKEFLNLTYCFFSNQSMLYNNKAYKKYRSFYQLLTYENIGYDYFQDYQKSEIDYLISNKFLITGKDGFLKIKNLELIFVIGKLFYEDVISFWHYPEKIRKEILRMEKRGLIKFENTLFTKEERRYFNYHLNQKEFSNGLDLRNKYLHGTNSDSKEEQENDYLILLKLLILVINKIKDDLNLYKSEQLQSNQND